jgi:hypothetical protein
MITVPVTLTATPQTVAELVQNSLSEVAQDQVDRDRNDLRMSVAIQASQGNGSDVNFGSADDQSGFLVAGGSMSISKLNLNKTYFVGDGLDIIIHLWD